MFAALFAAACSGDSGGALTKQPTEPPTPTPKPTQEPATPGGVHEMGFTITTPAGSHVTVFGWKSGAARSIAPGPGQRYESVDAQFCAGRNTRDDANDIAPRFSLELPNGNRVVADSQSTDGEFRSKGTIEPGKCVRAPLVFQVGGGIKPRFVVFGPEPETKWTVP